MKLAVIIFEAVLIVVLSAMVYWLAKPHLWRAVEATKITYDGQSATDANLYRSSQGDLLIRIKVLEKEDSVYIYYPSRRLIGVPNGNQFVYFPLYAFSKDVPPPVVMSNDRIKIESDMNLVINEIGVEFTTLSGGRVAVEVPAL